MYIEPNSTLIFLRNCPLDKKYEHTIYFADRTSQYNYFYSLKKRELNNLLYTRVSEGVCRVQLKTEDLYDCNYLMFKNTSFENRWFYAFIKDIKYVSNIVSEVYFEIDDIQTWLQDCELKHSFVEREHSLTDVVGENIVDEPVGLGEYTYSQLKATGLMSTPSAWSIVIATPYIDDDGDPTATAYEGTFSGLVLRRFDATAVTLIRQFLDGLGGRAEAIVSIYLLPTFITGTGEYVSGSILHSSYSTNKPTTLGDYTNIKNKKLLTYPYTYCGVTSNQGIMHEFKYEDFSSDNVVFDITGDCTPNANIICSPKKYKNQDSVITPFLGKDYNVNEAVVISEIPTVAWTSNAYELWLAQNKNKIRNDALLGFASGTITAVGGAVRGSAIQTAYGATTAIGSITSSLATIKDAQAMPNTVLGSTSGMLLKGIEALDFFFTQVYVKPEMAKIIDDFFSVYGYATKQVKVPNISSRPHWNYIQTSGCNLIGACSSDVIEHIKNIFDSGITFWRNGSEIGNYNLDNSPIE